MLGLLRRLASELAAIARGLNQALIEQSVETLELELRELEHAFMSIVFGSLVGLPLAPLGLAAEIAGAISEEEIRLLYSRTWRGGDVIGELFSSMGGEW